MMIRNFSLKPVLILALLLFAVPAFAQAPLPLGTFVGNVDASFSGTQNCPSGQITSAQLVIRELGSGYEIIGILYDQAIEDLNETRQECLEEDWNKVRSDAKRQEDL